MDTGGKAHALTTLANAGYTVPPFLVVLDTESEEETRERILKKFLEGTYYAVRSSSFVEDQKDTSHAGHFYSAVGVPLNRVWEEVLNVRNSYQEHGGTVIVQKCISSDRAGVVFSQTGESISVINATHCMCSPVVGGEACDEYLCQTDGTLLEEHIEANKPCVFFTHGETRTKLISEPSLSKTHLQRVVELGQSLEKFFDSPQDVEWCFSGDTLYVLQSRPITRTLELGELYHYDSANIAESYSGIVLPLTQSFARKVYEYVYKDLLTHSGISKSLVEKHSYLFENLLAFHYGRMYYTMNYWYKMAEFAPGYKRNKENFETMITSNVRAKTKTTLRPSLFLLLLYPWIIVFKVLTFDYVCAQFSKRVTEHLASLRDSDFSNLEYAESLGLFETINKDLLRKWYITVENDFFVMSFLGLLKKRLPGEELQRALVFPSKATEQVEALRTLSRQLHSDPRVWDAVHNHDASAFTQALSRNTHAKSALDTYVHTFGGRFASELKLESVGIDEDISKLFPLLNAYQEVPIKREVSATATSSYPLVTRLLLNRFKKYAGRREEFRLLRSNTFAMARKLFLHIGHLLKEEGALEESGDVFYLTLEEILSADTSTHTEFRSRVDERKERFKLYEDKELPAFFSARGTNMPNLKDARTPLNELSGRPASPGVVTGRVRIFKEFFVPSPIDFDILVTSHTDPGWTSLIALSKGLIIEHGGVLSHASIVARELGVPAVIGATGAMRALRNGDLVTIDGATGTITRM
jgi:phosphohistidine swiveling domain-containing protein